MDTNSCKYCNVNMYIKILQRISQTTKSDMLDLKETLYVPLETNYCPMCGRKVK